MEVVLLKPESPEWNEAWEWLGDHPVNDNIDNPKEALNEGEAWQYMGSMLKDGVLITDFRHRFHPKTDAMYKCSFKHEVYDEKNFQIKRKIK
jgi:hypothetical protein